MNQKHYKQPHLTQTTTCQTHHQPPDRTTLKTLQTLPRDTRYLIIGYCSLN